MSYSYEIRSPKEKEMSRPQIKLIVCYSIAVIAVVVVVSFVQGPQSIAQSTAQGESFKFEVASLRQNTSGEDRVSGGFLPGGYYRVTNYSLRGMIAAAYMR